MSPRDSELGGYLAVLLSAACWGTSGIFVKYFTIETQIFALALAFWRDASTSFVLLAFIGLRHPSWLRLRRIDLGYFVAMGGSLGVFHVFWNLGVMVNGVAVATVQQAAMPAIVAIVAWIFWRESLDMSKILAIVLTFIGTLLISGIDAIGPELNSIEKLLIGLSLPSFSAIYTLSTKKVRNDYNPFTTLFYSFLFASLVLLPFQLFTPQPQNIQPIAWIWFVGLILVSTVAGFSIYIFTLGNMHVSTASILAMSEIAFVAVYSSILLDEYLSSSQILGAIIVTGSVLFLSWHGWRTSAYMV